MSKMLPIGERQMSFFLNAFATKEALTITVNGLIDNIKSDLYAERINKIRSMTDKDERDAAKKQLPAVTVSGRFPSIRKDAEMQEPTNLIAVDIDKIDGHGHDIQTIKSMIACDPYVYALFETVSGNGLCAIVEYARGSDHRHVYLSLDEYFQKQYNVVIDVACKNESRLRFLCHDPDIHVNTDARIFTPERKRKQQPKQTKQFIAADDDFRHVANQIVQSRIDITGGYAQWRDLSFAIADGMGESGREVFHAISQFGSSYNERDCDQQYTRAIKATGSGITKATFFHAAKQAGFDIIAPSTKRIAHAANMGRRSHMPAEKVIEQLQADDIPPERAKPIVERIYATNERLEDGAKQDDFIKMAIRNYGTFRYNEITRKVELNGEEMDDIKLNSLYLHVRASVEGRPPSADLVRSIINSDFTPSYNPIKEFTEKAPARLKTTKPKIIKRLAESLILDQQDQAIALQYVCLWLVGMAESWIRNEPNPYMLMITGSQQGTGKTTFFRKLVPDELRDYYAEIKISGSKDDAILATEKVIIMVDEMAGLGKTDWDWIKQVLTQKTVTARPAYGRFTLTLPRIASWAGTSNQSQLLRDRTGTRRFLPLRIKTIDRDKYNAINKAELMWEAVWLSRAGWTSDLSIEDYNKINENNQQFAEVSVEEELITRFYAPVDTDLIWPTVTKNATEIAEYIESKTNGIHRMNGIRIGRALSQMGYANTPKWHNGKTQRVYTLKESP